MYLLPVNLTLPFQNTYSCRKTCFRYSQSGRQQQNFKCVPSLCSVNVNGSKQWKLEPWSANGIPTQMNPVCLVWLISCQTRTDLQINSAANWQLWSQICQETFNMQSRTLYTQTRRIQNFPTGEVSWTQRFGLDFKYSASTTEGGQPISGEFCFKCPTPIKNPVSLYARI